MEKSGCLYSDVVVAVGFSNRRQGSVGIHPWPVIWMTKLFDSMNSIWMNTGMVDECQMWSEWISLFVLVPNMVTFHWTRYNLTTRPDFIEQHYSILLPQYYVHVFWWSLKQLSLLYHDYWKQGKPGKKVGIRFPVWVWATDDASPLSWTQIPRYCLFTPYKISREILTFVWGRGWTMEDSITFTLTTPTSFFEQRYFLYHTWLFNRRLSKTSQPLIHSYHVSIKHHSG
jgi:hypothetical protein